MVRKMSKSIWQLMKCKNENSEKMFQATFPFIIASVVTAVENMPFPPN